MDIVTNQPLPLPPPRRFCTIRATDQVSARLEAEGRLNQKEVHICTVSYVRGKIGVRDFTYASGLLL